MVPLNPSKKDSPQTFYQSESLDLTPSTDYILFLYSCTNNFQKTTSAYSKFVSDQGGEFELHFYYRVSLKTSTLDHLS